MTGASATLLVISIITLNIIWGYPWVGMFSTCVSLLLVGWMISRIMRPRLLVNIAAPRSAPAGHPISIVLHAQNQGRLPAMNLAFDLQGKARRSLWSAAKHGSAIFRCNVLSSPPAQSMIESGRWVGLPSTILFERRGIQYLPDVTVTSHFPFYLFQNAFRYPVQTEIAITPRLLTGDEDAVAKGLLDTLGGWSHKLLSGDALDYTGSREYQVGMPVRRWDFTSWARLGRPIVREFQSPSIQLVNVIVDTASDQETPRRRDEEDLALERLLSLAATAVIMLTQRLVRVRLYTTTEEVTDQGVSTSLLMPSDSESMLIRLAASGPVSRDLADARLNRLIESVGRSPTLILTARSERTLPSARFATNLTILRVREVT
jgi:uncharacterized protein (DUF58 family)